MFRMIQLPETQGLSLGEYHTKHGLFIFLEALAHRAEKDEQNLHL